MAYQYAQSYSVIPATAPAATFTAAPATFDPNAFTTAAPVTATYAPAQYVTAAPAQYATYTPNPDEIRTIFVTGFPMDVRDRELVNMCRFLNGYEAASMKASGHGGPQGFVLFKYGQAAAAGMSVINGIDFGDGYRLRAEMARKNMYVRDGDRPAKTYRTDVGSAAPGGAGSSWGDRNADNQPCDTLFIGNLSPNVTEEDVSAYFRNLKGDLFKACKVNRSSNNRVSAFVQFVDVATAQEVHSSEQGKELPGSDRGPMRIQFSRNALGAGKRYRDHDDGYMPRQTPTPNSEISPGDGSMAAYQVTPDNTAQQQVQTSQPVQIMQPSQVVQGAPTSQPGEYAPPPDAQFVQAPGAQMTYTAIAAPQ